MFGASKDLKVEMLFSDRAVHLGDICKQSIGSSNVPNFIIS